MMIDNFKRGDLFNENGKWKYGVWLDYSEVDYENWDLAGEAKKALERATEKGLSNVVLRKIPPNWYLVVLEPMSKYEHPIIVRGENE